jgi:hypothetical protein
VGQWTVFCFSVLVTSNFWKTKALVIFLRLLEEQFLPSLLVWTMEIRLQTCVALLVLESVESLSCRHLRVQPSVILHRSVFS